MRLVHKTQVLFKLFLIIALIVIISCRPRVESEIDPTAKDVVIIDKKEIITPDLDDITITVPAYGDFAFVIPNRTKSVSANGCSISSNAAAPFLRPILEITTDKKIDTTEDIETCAVSGRARAPLGEYSLSVTATNRNGSNTSNLTFKLVTNDLINLTPPIIAEANTVSVYRSKPLKVTLVNTGLDVSQDDTGCLIAKQVGFNFPVFIDHTYDGNVYTCFVYSEGAITADEASYTYDVTAGNSFGQDYQKLTVFVINEPELQQASRSIFLLEPLNVTLENTGSPVAKAKGSCKIKQTQGATLDLSVDVFGGLNDRTCHIRRDASINNIVGDFEYLVTGSVGTKSSSVKFFLSIRSKPPKLENTAYTAFWNQNINVTIPNTGFEVSNDAQSCRITPENASNPTLYVSPSSSTCQVTGDVGNQSGTFFYKITSYSRYDVSSTSEFTLRVVPNRPVLIDHALTIDKAESFTHELINIGRSVKTCSVIQDASGPFLTVVTSDSSSVTTSCVLSASYVTHDGLFTYRVEATDDFGIRDDATFDLRVKNRPILQNAVFNVMPSEQFDFALTNIGVTVDSCSLVPIAPTQLTTFITSDATNGSCSFKGTASADLGQYKYQITGKKRKKVSIADVTLVVSLNGKPRLQDRTFPTFVNRSFSAVVPNYGGAVDKCEFSKKPQGDPGVNIEVTTDKNNITTCLLSHSLLPLGSQGTYTYRVKASNGDGESSADFTLVVSDLPDLSNISVNRFVNNTLDVLLPNAGGNVNIDSCFISPSTPNAPSLTIADALLGGIRTCAIATDDVGTAPGEYHYDVTASSVTPPEEEVSARFTLNIYGAKVELDNAVSSQEVNTTFEYTLNNNGGAVSNDNAFCQIEAISSPAPQLSIAVEQPNSGAITCKVYGNSSDDVGEFHYRIKSYNTSQFLSESLFTLLVRARSPFLNVGSLSAKYNESIEHTFANSGSPVKPGGCDINPTNSLLDISIDATNGTCRIYNASPLDQVDASSYVYTITAEDASGGTFTALFYLEYLGARPDLASLNLSYARNQTIHFDISNDGGAVLTGGCKITSGDIDPLSLTLSQNGRSCSVDATSPNFSGEFSYQITATSKAGSSVSALNLIVSNIGIPNLIDATNPTGTVGKQFSYVIENTGADVSADSTGCELGNTANDMMVRQQTEKGIRTCVLYSKALTNEGFHQYYVIGKSALGEDGATIDVQVRKAPGALVELIDATVTIAQSNSLRYIIENRGADVTSGSCSVGASTPLVTINEITDNGSETCVITGNTFNNLGSYTYDVSAENYDGVVDTAQITVLIVDRPHLEPVDIQLFVNSSKEFHLINTGVSVDTCSIIGGDPLVLLETSPDVTHGVATCKVLVKSGDATGTAVYNVQGRKGAAVHSAQVNVEVHSKAVKIRPESLNIFIDKNINVTLTNDGGPVVSCEIKKLNSLAPDLTIPVKGTTCRLRGNSGLVTGDFSYQIKTTNNTGHVSYSTFKLEVTDHLALFNPLDVNYIYGDKTGSLSFSLINNGADVSADQGGCNVIGTPQLDATVSSKSCVVSTTDALDLHPGEYRYKVIGYNAVGSPSVQRFNLTIKVEFKPSSSLSIVSLNDHQVRLSWADVTGASIYNLYRSETLDNPVLVATNIAKDHIDGLLSKGTLYHYWLRSCNGSSYCSTLSRSAFNSVRTSTHGLLSYYPFESAPSHAVTSDRVLFSYGAQLTSTTSTSDRNGSTDAAILFSSVAGSYASMPLHFLSSSDEGSITFWSLITASGGGENVFSFGANEIRLTNNGKLQLKKSADNLLGDNGSHQTLVDSVDSTNWFHFALTVKDDVKSYYNGEPAALSEPRVKSFSGATIDFFKSALSGSLDEVYLYTRELSASEVKIGLSDPFLVDATYEVNRDELFAVHLINSGNHVADIDGSCSLTGLAGAPTSDLNIDRAYDSHLDKRTCALDGKIDATRGVYQYNVTAVGSKSSRTSKLDIRVYHAPELGDTGINLTTTSTKTHLLSNSGGSVLDCTATSDINYSDITVDASVDSGSCLVTIKAGTTTGDYLFYIKGSDNEKYTDSALLRIEVHNEAPALVDMNYRVYKGEDASTTLANHGGAVDRCEINPLSPSLSNNSTINVTVDTKATPYSCRIEVGIDSGESTGDYTYTITAFAGSVKTDSNLKLMVRDRTARLDDLTLSFIRGVDISFDELIPNSGPAVTACAISSTDVNIYPSNGSCAVSGDVANLAIGTNNYIITATVAGQTSTSDLTINVRFNKPPKLKLTALADRLVKVEITDVSGASSYNLYRAIAGFTPTIVTVTRDYTSLEYLDDHLIKASDYYYWVEACDGAECSQKSEQAHVLTKDNSLLNFYAFESGIDLTKDYSGYSNHATISNTSKVISAPNRFGVPNKAVSSIKNTESYEFNARIKDETTGSIYFWFKLGQTATQDILTFGSSSKQGITYSKSNKLLYSHTADGIVNANTALTQLELNTKRWNLFTMTFSPSGVNTYLNGLEQKSLPFNRLIKSNDAKFTLRKNSLADDLLLVDRVLPLAEIRFLAGSAYFWDKPKQAIWAGATIDNFILNNTARGVKNGAGNCQAIKTKAPALPSTIDVLGAFVAASSPETSADSCTFTFSTATTDASGDYTFQLGAGDYNNNRRASVDIKIELYKLPAPNNFSSVVGAAIDLSWDTVTSADHYHLARVTNGNYQVVSADITTLTYTDATSAAQQHVYHIRACKTVRGTPYCYTAATTTTTAAVPPNLADISDITKRWAGETFSVSSDNSETAANGALKAGGCTLTTSSFNSDISTDFPTTRGRCTIEIITATTDASSVKTFTVEGESVSGGTDATSFTVTLKKLPAPSNFRNSIVSGSEIQLDWDTINNANYYKLSRRVNSGSFSIINGNINKTIGTTSDNSISRMNTYTYKLVACKTVRGTPYCYTAATTTTSAAVPPNLANISDIAKRWAGETFSVSSDNSETAANGALKAGGCTLTTSSFNSDISTDFPTTRGRCTIEIITATTDASSVKTFTVEGESVSGGTDATSFTVTLKKLPAPSNFRNSIVSGSEIQLDWDTINNANYYKLSRRVNSGSFSIINGNINKTIGTTSDNSISRMNTYTYKLVACKTVRGTPYCYTAATTTTSAAVPPNLANISDIAKRWAGETFSVSSDNSETAANGALKAGGCTLTTSSFNSDISTDFPTTRGRCTIEIITATTDASSVKTFTVEGESVSGGTDATSFTVTLKKLPAPSNFRNSIVSGSEIQLDWDTINNANYYKLSRRVNSGSFSIINGNINKTIGTTSDNSISRMNTYTYKLVACKTVRGTPYCYTAATTTTSAAVPPNLANISDIAKRWAGETFSVSSDNSETAANGALKAGGCTLTTSSFNSDISTDFPTTRGRCTIEIITATTDASSVKTFTVEGESVSGGTDATSFTVTLKKLPAPSNFRNSIVSGSEIQLDWDTINNANYYKLSRRVNSGSFSIINGNINKTIGTTSDNSISRMNTYTYKLVACKTVRGTPYCYTAATTTTSAAVPPNLANISDIAKRWAGETFSVSSDNSETAANGALKAGGCTLTTSSFNSDISTDFPTTRGRCTIEIITATTDASSVKTFTVEGESVSGGTDATSFTVTLKKHPAVTGFQEHSRSGTTVELRWTAVTTPSAPTHYKVERAKYDSGWGSYTFSTDFSGGTQLDNTIVSDKRYRYRISACQTVGNTYCYATTVVTSDVPVPQKPDLANPSDQTKWAGQKNLNAVFAKQTAAAVRVGGCSYSYRSMPQALLTPPTVTNDGSGGCKLEITTSTMDASGVYVFDVTGDSAGGKVSDVAEFMLTLKKYPQVTNLTAVLVSSEYNLEWDPIPNAPAPSGATTYLIQHKATAGSSFVTIPNSTPSNTNLIITASYVYFYTRRASFQYRVSACRKVTSNTYCYEPVVIGTGEAPNLANIPMQTKWAGEVITMDVNNNITNAQIAKKKLETGGCGLDYLPKKLATVPSVLRQNFGNPDRGKCAITITTATADASDTYGFTLTGTSQSGGVDTKTFDLVLQKLPKVGNFQASATAQIDLSWNEVTSADHYKLERQVSGSYQSVSDDIRMRTYQDTAASISQQHTYRISACKVVATVSYCYETVTTQNSPSSVIPPDLENDKEMAQWAGESLIVNFNNDESRTGGRLKTNADSGCTLSSVPSTNVPSSTVSRIQPDANPGKCRLSISTSTADASDDYNYTITGTSVTGGTDTANFKLKLRNLAVTNRFQQTSRSGGSVALEWDAVTPPNPPNTGVIKYRIERAESGTNTWTTPIYSNGSPHNDSGLDVSKGYRYRITSCIRLTSPSRTHCYGSTTLDSAATGQPVILSDVTEKRWAGEHFDATSGNSGNEDVIDDDNCDVSPTGIAKSARREGTASSTSLGCIVTVQTVTTDTVSMSHEFTVTGTSTNGSDDATLDITLYKLSKVPNGTLNATRTNSGQTITVTWDAVTPPSGSPSGTIKYFIERVTLDNGGNPSGSYAPVVNGGGGYTTNSQIGDNNSVNAATAYRYRITSCIDVSGTKHCYGSRTIDSDAQGPMLANDTENTKWAGQDFDFTFTNSGAAATSCSVHSQDPTAGASDALRSLSVSTTAGGTCRLSIMTKPKSAVDHEIKVEGSDGTNTSIGTLNITLKKLNKPGSVRVTGVGLVTWNAVSGADNYKITRIDVGTTNKEFVAEGITPLRYKDPNAKVFKKNESRDYKYYVAACKKVGNETYCYEPGESNQQTFQGEGDITDQPEVDVYYPLDGNFRLKGNGNQDTYNFLPAGTDKECIGERKSNQECITEDRGLKTFRFSTGKRGQAYEPLHRDNGPTGLYIQDKKTTSVPAAWNASTNWSVAFWYYIDADAHFGSGSASAPNVLPYGPEGLIAFQATTRSNNNNIQYNYFVPQTRNHGAYIKGQGGSGELNNPFTATKTRLNAPFRDAKPNLNTEWTHFALTVGSGNKGSAIYIDSVLGLEFESVSPRISTTDAGDIMYVFTVPAKANRVFKEHTRKIDSVFIFNETIDHDKVIEIYNFGNKEEEDIRDVAEVDLYYPFDGDFTLKGNGNKGNYDFQPTLGATNKYKFSPGKTGQAIELKDQWDLGVSPSNGPAAWAGGLKWSIAFWYYIDAAARFGQTSAPKALLSFASMTSYFIPQTQNHGAYYETQPHANNPFPIGSGTLKTPVIAGRDSTLATEWTHYALAVGKGPQASASYINKQWYGFTANNSQVGTRGLKLFHAPGGTINHVRKIDDLFIFSDKVLTQKEVNRIYGLGTSPATAPNFELAGGYAIAGNDESEFVINNTGVAVSSCDLASVPNNLQVSVSTIGASHPETSATSCKLKIKSSETLDSVQAASSGASSVQFRLRVLDINGNRNDHTIDVTQYSTQLIDSISLSTLKSTPIMLDLENAQLVSTEAANVVSAIDNQDDNQNNLLDRALYRVSERFDIQENLASQIASCQIVALDTASGDSASAPRLEAQLQKTSDTASSFTCQIRSQSNDHLGDFAYEVRYLNQDGLTFAKMPLFLEVSEVMPALQSSHYSIALDQSLDIELENQGGDAQRCQITKNTIKAADLDATLSLNDPTSCRITGGLLAAVGNYGYQVEAANAGGVSSAELLLDIYSKAPSFANVSADIEQYDLVDMIIANQGGSIVGECVASRDLSSLGLRLIQENKGAVQTCRLIGQANQLGSMSFLVSASNEAGEGVAVVTLNVKAPRVAIENQLYYYQIGQTIDHYLFNSGGSVLENGCRLEQNTTKDHAERALSLSVETVAVQGKRSCRISGHSGSIDGDYSYKLIALNQSKEEAISMITLRVNSSKATLADSEYSLKQNQSFRYSLVNQGAELQRCYLTQLADDKEAITVFVRSEADDQGRYHCIVEGYSKEEVGLYQFQISASNQAGTSVSKLRLIVEPALPELVDTISYQSPAKEVSGVIANKGGEIALDGCSIISFSSAAEFSTDVVDNLLGCVVESDSPLEEGIHPIEISASNLAGKSSAYLTFRVSSSDAPPVILSQTTTATLGSEIDVVLHNNGFDAEQCEIEVINDDQQALASYPVMKSDITKDAKGTVSCRVYGTIGFDASINDKTSYRYKIRASNAIGLSEAELTLIIRQGAINIDDQSYLISSKIADEFSFIVQAQTGLVERCSLDEPANITSHYPIVAGVVEDTITRVSITSGGMLFDKGFDQTESGAVTIAADNTMLVPNRIGLQTGSLSFWYQADEQALKERVLLTIGQSSIVLGDSAFGTTLSYRCQSSNCPLLSSHSASSDSLIAVSNQLTDSAWHHIALIADQQHLRVYIDGVLAGKSKGASLIPAGDFEFAQGSYDDIRLYATSLTAFEVKQVIKSRIPLESQSYFDAENKISGCQISGKSIKELTGDYLYALRAENSNSLSLSTIRLQSKGVLKPNIGSSVLILEEYGSFSLQLQNAGGSIEHCTIGFVSSDNQAQLKITSKIKEDINGIGICLIEGHARQNGHYTVGITASNADGESSALLDIEVKSPPVLDDVIIDTSGTRSNENSGLFDILLKNKGGSVNQLNGCEILSGSSGLINVSTLPHIVSKDQYSCRVIGKKRSSLGSSSSDIQSDAIEESIMLKSSNQFGEDTSQIRLR